MGRLNYVGGMMIHFDGRGLPREGGSIKNITLKVLFINLYDMKFYGSSELCGLSPSRPGQRGT